MKILHLSTYDITGGAARAAYRLHNGLRTLGHDSTMLVERRASRDPAVVAFRRPMDLRSRLARRLRRERIARDLARYASTRRRGEWFSDDRTGHGAALAGHIPPADVINLHWIAQFVDYRAFFGAIPARTPVVWTLHDMSPFTGGCHYDWGCSKFSGQCGACPALGSSRPDDLARDIWRRKQDAFARVPEGRLHIVAPSRWMAAEAGRSALLGRFPVAVIPNGIDTGDFAPRDRAAARDALGIPPGVPAVLFVADQMDQARKGFSLLVEALRGLDDARDLHLLSIGSSSPALDLPFPHLHLGRIDSDRLLSLVYSAADVFALPSLQDNLPNTVIEALACGTPVAAFDAGGTRDMVRPGETGALAPAGDVEGLRRALADLLRDPDRRAALGENCRRVAVQEYAIDVQAQRYADLYAAILAGEG